MIMKSSFLKTSAILFLFSQVLLVGCKKTEAIYKGDLSKYRDRAFQCLQNDDTNHILFDGCIDWHSAVHAHWAVLRYANHVAPSEESDIVVDRLKSTGLALEREYMNERPNFEMPYGRAWFLALAIEFEQMDADATFEAMADDMASSLRNYLDGRDIDPGIREYGNHTWALTQLLRFYRHRSDVDGEQWVSALIEEHYLDYDPSINPANELNRSDFFSLWSNWALLLGEYDLESLSEWLDQQTLNSEDIRPINVSNSRRAGGNASRLWGLSWILQVSDDPIYRDAVDAHIESTEQSFDDYEGDYGYGHWVSQFAIYALTQPGMSQPITP